MKKPAKKKRTIEFSKWILIAVSVMVFYIIGFSSYMMIVTKDLSPLAYLIPSIFVEAASATAYYYNKAKAEAELKIPYYQQKEAESDEEQS